MTTITTATREPTDQQAMLIKLAMAKRGTTRAAVRDALGYDEHAAIPVQAMLKKLADRFGYAFSSEIGPDRVATYRFDKTITTGLPKKAPRRRNAAR